jgi:hypothetical protein
MTKLEQFYNSLQNLRDHGLPLPDMEDINRVEEEIIQKEIIPALSDAIATIISQIQRGLILEVTYGPDESLQVKMILKSNREPLKEEQQSITGQEEINEEQPRIIPPHPKEKATNLVVSFPDGTQISNQKAYQTLCDTIEKVGPESVMKLGIQLYGIDLVSKTKNNRYQQHKIKGGYLVLSHSSTEVKKTQLEEISRRLNLNLEVKVKIK